MYLSPRRSSSSVRLVCSLASVLGLAPALLAQAQLPIAEERAGAQEPAAAPSTEVPETDASAPVFVAHDHFLSSPGENKQAALPRLRASRAPRKRVGTIGDVTEWRRGASIVKRSLESVVPKGYSQWSSNLHKKALQQRGGSYTWDNVGVTAAPDAGQLKWGTREYNCPDRVFKDCDFTRIPQEHGLYVSNYGDTTLDGCTFLLVGSQGAQWAHRPLAYAQYGADCIPYQSPPTHIVRDTHFVDCGFQGVRPSFNLTYFDPGTSANPGTLLVEDSSFVSRWTKVRGDGARSTGALVLAHMSAAPPLDAEIGPMMESVTLRNVLFDFDHGDRPIVEIRSAAELVIEDCAFIARDHPQPYVMVDRDNSGNDLGGTKTERIVLRDNRSRGVVLLLCLSPAAGGPSQIKLPLHCPGEEIVYSGVTGRLIARRQLDAPESSRPGDAPDAPAPEGGL
ncbi:MAG: hypothetical protein P8M11_07430 [Planctomycetota bacterium]|nr:hypothetical protein [Planctomycetota bacterium]